MSEVNRRPTVTIDLEDYLELKRKAVSPEKIPILKKGTSVVLSLPEKYNMQGKVTDVNLSDPSSPKYHISFIGYFTGQLEIKYNDN